MEGTNLFEMRAREGGCLKTCKGKTKIEILKNTNIDDNKKDYDDGDDYDEDNNNNNYKDPAILPLSLTWCTHKPTV